MPVSIIVSVKAFLSFAFIRGGKKVFSKHAMKRNFDVRNSLVQTQINSTRSHQ